MFALAFRCKAIRSPANDYFVDNIDKDLDDMKHSIIPDNSNPR